MHFRLQQKFKSEMHYHSDWKINGQIANEYKFSVIKYISQCDRNFRSNGNAEYAIKEREREKQQQQRHDTHDVCLDCLSHKSYH